MFTLLAAPILQVPIQWMTSATRWAPPLNSKAARTPLIVNAAPHDSRHAFAEPLLHGNLLGVTCPAVRWGPNVSQALLPAPSDEWRDTRVELALCGRAAQRVRYERIELVEQIAPSPGTGIKAPLVAAHETARALGTTMSLVQGSPNTAKLIRSVLNFDSTLQYYGTLGTVLEWGMGAAGWQITGSRAESIRHDYR